MPTLPPRIPDPGDSITLPTMDDVLPGSKRLGGCYISEDCGEAIFVPPKDFMAQNPLWRIDVLQDLIDHFELVRRHAFVEWARSLVAMTPQVDESRHLEAIRHLCDQAGIIPPENMEALLVLADRLKPKT